jgi:hypothetical protein
MKVVVVACIQEKAVLLKDDDQRASKVESIRTKLEDALLATQQALGLHEKRLKDLQVCAECECVYVLYVCVCIYVYIHVYICVCIYILPFAEK